MVTESSIVFDASSAALGGEQTRGCGATAARRMRLLRRRRLQELVQEVDAMPAEGTPGPAMPRIQGPPGSKMLGVQVRPPARLVLCGENFLETAARARRCHSCHGSPTRSAVAHVSRGCQGSDACHVPIAGW